MGKTSKKHKINLSKPNSSFKRKNKRKKRTLNQSTFHNTDSILKKNSQIPKSKKSTISNSNFQKIMELKNIFTLLSEYFDPTNQNVKNTEQKLLTFLDKFPDKDLFVDYDNLLTLDEFLGNFIQYLKIKMKDEKENIDQIFHNDDNSLYFNIFEHLKNVDIEFLFAKNISSYIRQDLLLSIFNDINNIESYFNIFSLHKNSYKKIDKKTLLRSEGINEFMNEFLFSNVVFNSIKTTLNKFKTINDLEIKTKIKQALNNITFYYTVLPKKYTAITVLGNNIVIRKYFYIFPDIQKIKVSLKNVIAHELVYLLVLKILNNNLFNSSFNNKEVKESGDFFEKNLYGEKISFYSEELINYLNSQENLSKKNDIFVKEVQNIYGTYCKNKENIVKEMTDAECYQSGIVRNNQTIICRKYHCLRHKMG